MAVSVKLKKIVLPAYETGEENLMPDFVKEGNQRVYPYSRCTDLKEGRTFKTYKAVVIENEYLKLTVLPELGGRLYSAVEKYTGRDMFYANPSVKPSLIQLYGAWIASGLEFNFPMGHSITSFKTVDSHFFKGKGYATCVVGNIDLATRMRWSVFITLREGESRFELEVKLDNRSFLPERFYFWANAAIPATRGTRVNLPVDKVLTGSFGVRKFPVDNDSEYYRGKDLNYDRSFDYGGEVFAKDCVYDFYGCYNDDTDSGMIMNADHKVYAGKKYFTWGPVGGKSWNRLLIDSGPDYGEIQTGPFESQAEFRFMQPAGRLTWKQHYFPINRTKGFVWANEEVALNIIKEGSELSAYAAVSRPLRKARVTFKFRGKKYFSGIVDLLPGKAFKAAGPAGKVSSGKVEFTVLHKGKEIFRYVSPLENAGKYKSGTKKEYSGVEKLYMSALRREEYRMIPEAPGRAHGYCPEIPLHAFIYTPRHNFHPAGRIQQSRGIS